MKFTVLPSDLKRVAAQLALINVSKAVTPAYDYALITPVVGRTDLLRLTSTNGDVSISVTMPVTDADDIQPALIFKQKLSDFASNAASVFPIDFVFDGFDWSLSDTAGDFHMTNSCVPSEFPVDVDTLLDPENVTQRQLPASVAISQIAVASRFASEDDSRPVMTGVCVDFRADGAMVASSNSKWLFTSRIDRVACNVPKSIVLSSSSAAVLPKLFSEVKADDTITLSHNPRYAYFRHGDTALITRLIEGRYPRYEQVIPKDYFRTATFDKSMLEDSIRRAGILVNNQGVLCMRFDKKRVKLTSRDIGFSLSSNVILPLVEDNNIAGKVVGFNPNLIMGALSVFQSPQVLFTMRNAKKPVLMRYVDSDDVRMLIMPTNMKKL